MAKHFFRSCPRCNDYLWVILPHPESNKRVQALNGQCLGCGYRTSLASDFWQTGFKNRIVVRLAKKSSKARRITARILSRE
jgi:hypothetical protein